MRNKKKYLISGLLNVIKKDLGCKINANIIHTKNNIIDNVFEFCAVEPDKEKAIKTRTNITEKDIFFIQAAI